MFKLHVRKELASTNSYLRNLLLGSKKIEDNLAVLAFSQSQGVGKLQSKWESPEGNLYLSLLLKESNLIKNIKEATIVSLLISVALRDTLKFYINDSSVSLHCKWVNDVLVNCKKISGILLELEKDLAGNQCVIIGIGVNLNIAPTISKYPVTSLKEVTKKEIDVLEVANLLLNNIDKHLLILQEEGKAIILEKWLESAYLLNQEVKINIGTEVLDGVFTSITEEGYLVLKKDGKTRVITAGEVFNFDEQQKEE